MPTPKAGYRTADGTRVPGVTTILGKLKDPGALMWWANRLALEPLLKARFLIENRQPGEPGWEESVAAFLSVDPARYDHRAEAQRAADAGTVAHEMFDCHVRSKDFDSSAFSPESISLAAPAFEAARQWVEQTRYEVIETEVALVSEKYRFGGTRDGILVSGKRALGDVKTSKGIYGEYLAQLGAYAILDEEHGYTIDGGFHILRFSKQEKPTDPVRFEHKFWSHLDAGKKAFLLYRELYDLAAELERLAK